ncbi:MAG: HlyD family efflux transporter periplasmic adaptor subunit, partial [Boseongicola sp.]
MLGSRKIRVASAIFILTAVVNLLWPRATGYVSTFAVVNAPVMTIRAPINGVVLQASPAIAAPVAPNDVLFDMRATFDRQTQLARLIGEVTAKSAQAAALRTEEAAMRAALVSLRKREIKETESEIAYLNARLDEETAIRLMLVAQKARAEYHLDRLAKLSSRGTVPEKELKDAQFKDREIEALISASTARLKGLRIEIAAIEQSLPSPAGTGRRDGARIQFDDLMLSLGDIRARRETAEGELLGLNDALAGLRSEYQKFARFQSVAPSNGVIWTASRSEGSSVTLGSDLFQVLDCDRRFLEVVFAEHSFEDIPPGTRALVQIRGSSETFETLVVSRHAAGGGAHSAVDAAVLEPHKDGGVKVFLALDPSQVSDPAVAAAFCDVGRTAEVRIRNSDIYKWIDPVLDFLVQVGKYGQTILADAHSAY